VEIEKLIRIGYATMQAADQTTMAIETLKRALDHKGLARHLLAVPCNTVDAVVTAAEEYFQVSGTYVAPRGRHTVATLETEHEVKAVKTEQDTMQQLLKAVEENTCMLGQLMRQNTGRMQESSPVTADQSPNWRMAQSTVPRTRTCFVCQSPDHFKKDCPVKRSGNGASSQ
jgi:hypothetical protein